MAISTEQQRALAQVYASSVLQIADEAAQAETVLDELRGLSAVIEQNAEFSAFLLSPTIDVHVRERAIEKLLRGKVSDMIVNALQVMNRKGRLDIVPRLAEAFAELLDQKRGRVEVHVASAVPLTDVSRKDVSAWLVAYTGKQVVLRETVQPSMLGGLSIQVGDEKFDSSVRSRLVGLRERLMERASRELHSGRSYTA